MKKDNTEQDMTPIGDSERAFFIVSPKNTDSFGTSEWKKYLDKNKLNQAWSALKNNPFARFEKKKTIDSVSKFSMHLQPRYSDHERTCENEIQNLIETGILGRETAVILDSGGAHSVAMAAKLARKLGYQPIIMFDTEPHVKGVNRVEQGLATLLYFAQEIEKLKETGVIKDDAPPVFVLDRHRDADISPDSDQFYNGYSYTNVDLPNAETLIKHGIKNIVYLNEGNQHGKITKGFQSTDRLASDLKDIVNSWKISGINIIYTGISPSLINNISSSHDWHGDRLLFQVDRLNENFLGIGPLNSEDVRKTKSLIDFSSIKEKIIHWFTKKN